MIRNVFGIVLLNVILSCTRGQNVQTDKGKIQGQTVSVLGKDVDVFYKIPFAKPPVGERRFKHPEVPDSWEPEVKDGRTPAPSCSQSIVASSFSADFRVVPNDYSEDCLYLTVVRPSTRSGKAAVMVWIHGGGYTAGSTRSMSTEGHYLAAEMDVIVVSVPYRLGLLGFAYLSKDTIPGNMGMMDQRLGLEWVHNNIEQFGGDSGRVTLIGESAGATSIGLHLLSPLSKDLFQRAILQSGSPVAPWASTTPNRLKLGTSTFATAVGCNKTSDLDTAQCISSLDIERLLQVQAQFSASLTVTLATPIVDGYFLPSPPATLLAEGKYNKTSILHGINADESSFIVAAILMLRSNSPTLPSDYKPTDSDLKFFTSLDISSQRPYPKALSMFYESIVEEDRFTPLDVIIKVQSDVNFGCPAYALGTAVASSTDVYLYKYDHLTTVAALPPWMGVVHSYEIEYVFGYPLNTSVGYTPAEVALSRAMMTYWTNFAKTGNPNSPVNVSVPWPKYDNGTEKYLNIDSGSDLRPREGLLRHECTFVNEILPMLQQEQPPQPTESLPCVNDGSTMAVMMTLILTCLTFPLLLNRFD